MHECTPAPPARHAARRAGGRARPAALALCLAALVHGAAAQGHADSCQQMIPRSLGDALARAFPGFRAPLEYDNAPEDIERASARGRNGCLGVATADLTGESKQDYVIGLTARHGGAGIAVVALPRKGGWRFQVLERWPANARALRYVEVVAAGQYARAPAAVVEPGAAALLNCANAGALTGVIGGGETLYCLAQGRWAHLPIARQEAPAAR